MSTQPSTLSTEVLYKGRIFDVLLTEIGEGDVEYKREIVAHNGSTVIVPVFADTTVALVRQYRHPAGKHLLEIPAGGLNIGEEPEKGALRELEEEIGVRAARIEKVSEFYVSPGFLTEKMFLFLATELTETQQNLEDDELLSIEKYTFRQAFEMIRTGEIEDAKTIIGLMLAGAKLGLSFET